MSEHRITQRWLKYVLRGEGKSRSDASERYSYRGPVLYSYTYPVARLIKSPHRDFRDWFCITKVGVHPHNPKEWTGDKGPRLAETLYNQPCIGVFSQFEGDMVDDDATHERIKMLNHCEAQYLIECAQVWPADKLLIPNVSWKGQSQLTREMGLLYGRYAKYRESFALRWLEFPKHYDADLTAAINARHREYFDPKMVEQRERQSARREAKKAFGLDD